MHLPEVVSAVSAIAAIISAIRAWSSARSAAKSYRLAFEQEQARKPKLDLYLVEGERILSKDDDVRTYRFHLRITNQAQAANALVEILFEIDYARGATEGLRLAIPKSASDSVPQPQVELPKMLPPKEAIAGWVAFDVPVQLLAGARTDVYRIIVVDSNGNRYNIRPIIIPERES